MSGIRERILTNIRYEIRAFLRDGTPLPERDERWKEDTQKMMLEEQELYEKEQHAKQMADYETMNSNLKKAYEQSSNGTPYEEWLDKAQRLYRIEGTTVISIASGLDKEREWQTNSFWQAKKKVLQLIYYKYYDHFKKGHDFRFDPDEGEV